VQTHPCTCEVLSNPGMTRMTCIFVNACNSVIRT